MPKAAVHEDCELLLREHHIGADENFVSPNRVVLSKPEASPVEL